MKRKLAEENINEYEEDSSDEEDLRNTIGNIPANWYQEYAHLGYNLDGKSIIKPLRIDKLQHLLHKIENPGDFYSTVIDKQTGQKVKLSDEDIDFALRVLGHKVPDGNYNLYEPFLDLYSHEVSEMPLSGRPEHKRSFLPSKHERIKVARIANLIKNGLYKHRKPNKVENFYDLWKPKPRDDFLPDNTIHHHVRHHIPAPKMQIPGHRDSYNAAPEYRMKSIHQKLLKDANAKKSTNVLKKIESQKPNSVRLIPRYEKAYKDLYDRIIDITLVPRKSVKRVVAKSEDFFPSIPRLLDLRPYPTLQELVFEGHRSIIRSISVHPSGKLLASGSDDHTIKFWELTTGRCLTTIDVEGAVKCVSWNPNPELFFVAVALEKVVIMINPESYMTNTSIINKTNAAFKKLTQDDDYEVPEKVVATVTWRKPTPQEWAKGYRVVLDHFKEVKQVAWHRQGDYFASLMPDGISRSVVIHQLSKWRSHLPFQKNKGHIQHLIFHPTKPHLYISSQIYIRIYNLKKLKIAKKIKANSRYISSLAVHPKGEHFVIGTYENKVNWFEYELTKFPHVFRYHTGAVRTVAFHRRYPLFATGSDDGKIIVTHSSVYDDWLKDPLIVPVKQLIGHMKFDDLCILDLAWHPHEPYLISAGADATIRLWH